MKRFICILLSLALMLPLLAGCGGRDQEETTGVSTAQTTGDTSSETTAASVTENTTTLGTVIMTRSEQSSSSENQTGEPSDTTASSDSSDTGEDTTADTTSPKTTLPPETPGTEPPASSADTTALTNAPSTGNVETINGVLTVGASAMEYYYTSSDGLQKYADNINALKSYLPDVNVYAMFIPIAIAFNCPDGVSGGSDQKAAMENWYSMMPGVTGVDTYSALEAHKNEYLYFRTDTHWTQRGGYYAYTAFCNAAGFTANPIGAYEYASSTGYLGYMYTILKGTSVGDLMSANPDTVEKFKPVSSLSAVSYSDPSMSGSGTPISVVNLESGNYYAFTQGDQPLIHIKNSSVSNGRVAIVTKDSYGNTLVPFLADCFEEVYVVDQRYFNTDSTYSLNIVSFAQTHGVTDFIVEANAFNASVSGATFGKLLP